MQHADPDQLALVALGESSDDEDSEVTVHLRQCELCRSEVESLRLTAALARETVEYRTEDPRPPAAVWDRIAVELDLSADPGPRTEDGRSGEHGVPVNVGPGTGGVRRTGGGTTSHRTADGERRRRWVGPVAALVAAAAVGVVGTLVAVRPWQDSEGAPVAARSSAVLEPVSGGPGGVSGRVVIVQGTSGAELDVTAAGLPLQQGYYEVWVFDGERGMVSVGVLGGDSSASLPLPPTLDLRRYHVVDISQEKYDGDQTHSQVSVLRGTLTG